MPKENVTSEYVAAKENNTTIVTLNCLIHKARATKLALGKYTR